MHACKPVEAQEVVAVDALDDGWGLPGQSSESLIRIMPDDTDAFPSEREEAALDAFDLDGGWNLAEGTGEHQPPSFPPSGIVPIEFCPAPLQGAGTLDAEQQAEFSKPDLALGTDIDLPPPGGAWFAELTGVVPRTPPRAATKAVPAAPRELHLKSCFTESEDAFFANGDDLELAHQQEQQEQELGANAEAPKVKRRWWQRSKRN